jgi:prepilin-type N-terminal cleavage/methylation domain-containing protein
MRIMTPVRRGFTLVEMLVAMALTIFIMSILSQAFVAGLDTFRGLKAIGDMQENLRTAATIVRSDLAHPHFEGNRKLSDPWEKPPKQGYFFIRQGSAMSAAPGAPYKYEGADSDNIDSFRAFDHVMAFTIRLRGNQKENYLRSSDIPVFMVQPQANAPPKQRWSPLSKPGLTPQSMPGTNFFGQPRDTMFNPGGPLTPYVGDPNLALDPSRIDTFASQWAEVVYFLWKTGTTDEPENPFSTTGTPLFALYRAQYLLVPNTTEANNPTGPDVSGTTPNSSLTQAPHFYSGISCNPRPAPDNTLLFNSPDDLANTTSTFTATPIPPSTVQMPILTAGMERRAVWPVGKTTFKLPLYDQQTPGDGGLPVTPDGVPAARQPNKPPRNATLVCSNVVSFNIRVHFPNTWASQDGFSDIPALPTSPAASSPRIWDTTLVQHALAQHAILGGFWFPHFATIEGVKVTIRVFDPITKQSRQITVVQDT